MYKNVRVEPDDLVDYATKKYDVEPEEVEAWLTWIKPDEDERTETYALHELQSRSAGEYSTDHPHTRAYTLLCDYMMDNEFAQINLTQ